ncbi:MAG: glycosyltransferase family 2 protein [Geobacteraceae bacterium]|nr:glycosyltransferase family 2 protein [Geobacteraceae bacterium]
MPLISIVTGTYNAAATLLGNLESLQNQTVQVEHILIDGCSTDSTIDFIKRYPSPLRRLVSEPDNGIYDAMNKGIKLATGDVIGILNADDFYADNNVLERVAKVFDDPEIAACYGDLLYVKEQGTVKESQGTMLTIQNINRKEQTFETIRYWKSGPFQSKKFYWGWMPPHPTFFVRRSVYEKYGLFDLDLGSAADYELMLRFLLKHRINVTYIPEVLVKMRVGGVSNVSFANRLRANQMDRKAWAANGLKPHPWTLWMKPLRKVPQWWQRPPK